jgi:hypothetical protein
VIPALHYQRAEDLLEYLEDPKVSPESRDQWLRVAQLHLDLARLANEALASPGLPMPHKRTWLHVTDPGRTTS